MQSPDKNQSYFDSKEDEYTPAWQAWKSNQTPAGNAEFIKAVAPLVDRGVSAYAAGNPLAKAQAKVLAVHAARTYDPSKAKLSSHIHNQLQQLQRLSRQQTEVIRVPERILLERNALRSTIEQLRDDLGREPADTEIADASGLSLQRLQQIRSYKAGLNTGRVDREEGDDASGSPAVRKFGIDSAQKYWLQVVYDDLKPVDQRIMELSLGLNGQPRLSNQQIAARLKLSAGAITQRKAKIQRMLDRETELSPFLG